MHNHNINNKYNFKKCEITEQDFYPPEDTRLYESGIDDIIDGDNFADYSNWFYNNYEHEIFDV